MTSDSSTDVLQSGAMPTAPSVQNMSRVFAGIRAALDELEEQYRWAHNIAYGTGSSSIPAAHSSNPADVDPTGRTAAHDVEARANLAFVATKLQATRAVLKGLAKVMRRPPIPHSGRVDGFPRTVSKEDRQALEDAKTRRAARSEGYGSG